MRTLTAIAIVALVAGTKVPAYVFSPAIQKSTITGIVVTTDATPQPLPRAVVTIVGGGITDNLSVVTDDAGRFLFPDLPAGRYSISVSKPAYLPMNYGATQPGRPGTAVAIQAGQKIDVRIPLPRGGVITGMVRDSLGNPAPGVDVLIVRKDVPGSRGQYITGFPTTDDRGVYRAFGLLPDEYYVCAIPRNGLGGLAGETYTPRRDEVDAKLRQLEQRSTTTSSASNPASIPKPTSPPPAQTQITFVPIYYPGTPVSADAVYVRVAAGEERRGIDITLVPARAVNVSGVIQTGGIVPQSIRPQLSPVGTTQGLFAGAALRGPDADGAFSFSGVLPGRYILSARTGPTVVPAMFGMAEFTVDAADIAGLVVALRPAGSVSGRVAFDATTAKPPENKELVRLSLLPVGGPQAGNSVMAYAKSDGTFAFIGVMPGTYTVTWPTPLAGWSLRSVIVNGRDILDTPFEIEPSSLEVTDVVVTFSDRRAELQGTLSTATGQPASEFVVMVFPTSKEMWRPGARRIKSVRPGTDGAFTLVDLPAGEYFVAAITDADASEWQQPSFLEQLVPASIKVTIADGQKTRQDLRIAR